LKTEVGTGWWDSVSQESEWAMSVSKWEILVVPVVSGRNSKLKLAGTGGKWLFKNSS
jgi:hypothetical protein